MYTTIMSTISELPLPDGWIKQAHESGHPYYVDTRANPPRSIWVHPYEDEQYLSEHPEAREKMRHTSVRDSPPSFTDRRHSYNDHASARGPPNQPQKKRGFFGKLKDKAIGTKEEREAEKQRIAMLQAQRRQQMLAQRASYGPGTRYQYAQPQYGAPYGPSPYGYGAQPGMGMAGQRRGGMGGGGMALPLLGGMAGGLLLGNALDGFDHDHGYDDYGGGGFDGGGFDGGGFDGGFD
ncbi:hypothetical protein VNI00_001727 [Paramarasmius palmivorus]|uniref:WW domain-containing protein n=1 Tax=Paramarasmius palmivorus TaxID=297713 RepID=A0AAW0E2N8_9AGAR